MQAQPTIFEITAECRKSFTECQHIAVLQDGEWAENRLGDFNLWASGIGASARYKASLDARLALSPDARGVVVDILQLLKSLLDKCMLLAQSENPKATEALPEGRNDFEDGEPAEGSTATSHVEASLSWSDDSSSDSEIDGSQKDGLETSLTAAKRSVDLMLEQLTRIALSIRRSGTRSRLQKADRTFRTEDHKELCAHLCAVIFAQRNFSPEYTYSPKHIESQELHDIQLRLVNCNLKRRNRFLHAQKHSKGLEAMKIIDHKGLKSEEVASGPEYKPKILEQDQLPTVKRPTSVPVLQSQEHSLSTGTSASRATGPLSLLQNPVPSQAATTQLSTTVVNLDYPHPPKMHAAALVFKCPCCCQTLPTIFADKNRWKKHVAEDLCPYTCVLPNCPKPEILYTTKDTWKTHLMEDHSSVQYWVCFACTDAVQFDSEDAFEAHILREHQDTISQSQMPMIKKVCKRSAPADVKSCPLCPWPAPEDGDVDKGAVLDHIAEDVHNFSLRSLPWAPDDDDENEGRVEFSVGKVQDWIDKHDISSEIDQEIISRSETKKRDATHYFDHNEYFAHDIANSSESSIGSIDTLKKELIQLRGEVSLAFSDKSEGSKSSDTNTPYWNVPFARNEKFYGRLSELDELENALIGRQMGSTPLNEVFSRFCVITGHAGVGKTQVALELAYRAQETNSTFSVIWITANSRIAYKQAIRDVAFRLKLQLGQDDSNAYSAIQRYLSQERAGKWLMIFDDVNFGEIGWDDQNLPKSQQGCVVFTTRDSTTPSIQGGLSTVIDIGFMEAQEAMLMWCHTYRLGWNTAIDPSVLRTLGLLPYNILVVGEHASQTGIALDRIPQLISDISAQDDSLSYAGLRAHAWNLVHTHFIKDRPHIASYMYFISFLDPNSVPLSFFPPDISREQQKEAVSTLVSYGFIQLKETEDAFTISRLFHEYTYDRLKNQPGGKNYIEEVVSLLLETLPPFDREHKRAWRLYHAHLDRLLHRHLSDHTTTKAGEDLMWQYAEYVWSEGSHTAAKSAIDYVLDSRILRLGDQHLDTASARSGLARVLMDMKEYVAALQCATKSLQTLRRTLGPEHKDTLIAMANLAFVHFNNGRYAEAMELEEEILNSAEKSLGLNHPLTITAMDNLAATYTQQERWKDALELEAEILKRRNRLLGHVHSDTLDTLGHLAMIYQQRKMWEEAQSVLLELNGCLTMMLGDDHLDTLLCQGRWAYVMRKRGETERAMSLLKDIWTRLARVLGEKHPATKDTLAVLSLWQLEDMDSSASRTGDNVGMERNDPTKSHRRPKMPVFSNEVEDNMIQALQLASEARSEKGISSGTSANESLRKLLD